MAKVYANLIRKGLKTIDDVPAALRAEVEARLKELADVSASDVAAENSDWKGGAGYGSRLRNPDYQGTQDARTGPRDAAGAGRAAAGRPRSQGLTQAQRKGRF